MSLTITDWNFYLKCLDIRSKVQKATMANIWSHRLPYTNIQYDSRLNLYKEVNGTLYRMGEKK